MEATAPQFIGANLHGAFSDPTPTSEYKQLPGAEEFTNGLGVEINTPDYTIYLYEGGNFKIEGVKSREYIHRAETTLKNYADTLDTNIQKFKPHEATFAGKLHNATIEDIKLIKEHIHDLPHLSNTRKHDNPLRPDITTKLPLNNTPPNEKPNTNTNPSDENTNEEHTETATLRFFLSRREYSITLPIQNTEDIETLSYTLHNKIHHGIIRNLEQNHTNK